MPWRQSNILLWFSRSEHYARIIEGLDFEFIVQEFIWSCWCWHINLFIFNRSSTQSCYISIIKCLEANLFVFTDSPAFDRICCPYYEDYFILFIDVVLDNVVVSIIQFSFYPGIIIIFEIIKMRNDTLYTNTYLINAGFGIVKLYSTVPLPW